MDIEKANQKSDVRFYTMRWIFFCTYIGGPLAGCYLMSKNFESLNKKDLAEMTLKIGIISAVILFGAAVFIPHNTLQRIPAFVIPVSYTTIIYMYAYKLQGKEIDEYIKKGGKKHSGWRATAVGILSLIISFIYSFALVTAIEYFTIRKPFNEGMAYLSKGNNDLAIDKFNRVIRIDPKNTAVFISRGNAYFAKGETNQAITDYTKAIEMDPKLANAYYDRGLVYGSQGNSTQAISDFTKTIEINTKFSLAFYSRGLAYDSQGNFTQAISDYTKAIEINPNLVQAYCDRGLVYAKNGNHDQAISDFNKAIKINSSYAEAYFNRGFAYSNKANYDQAILDYSKAAELNPKLAEAYNNRAVAYFFKGDYDNSWKDAQKAESLGNKVNPDFLDNLKKASGREK